MFTAPLFVIAKKRRDVKGNRRRGRQKMRWLDSIINSMDMNLRKLPETVEDRGTRHATVHEIAKNWTWLTTEQQQYGNSSFLKNLNTVFHIV